MTRWDLAYPGTPPTCLLAGEATYNSRSMRASSDQDKLQLVAGAHVCRWACAVVRSNGCGWDDCTGGLPTNSTCGNAVPSHTMAQKIPRAWWRAINESSEAGLPVPLAFDAAPTKEGPGIVAVFTGA